MSMTSLGPETGYRAETLASKATTPIAIFFWAGPGFPRHLTNQVTQHQGST